MFSQSWARETFGQRIGHILWSSTFQQLDLYIIDCLRQVVAFAPKVIIIACLRQVVAFAPHV